MIGGDQPEVQCAVESNGECLSSVADLEIGERKGYRRRQEYRRIRCATPVQHDCGIVGVTSTSMIVGISRAHGMSTQGHVEAGIRNDPYAESPQRVVARQLTAYPCRADG